ncbi:hypothetical protein MMC15_000605 [Xylographa vitiligo]|nr:hypothetical protein [Xylographa vitiligo]
MEDNDFSPHTWEELRTLIADNNLAALRRKPSEAVTYRSWIEKIKPAYGSATNYLCQERLHWNPLPISNADTRLSFSYESNILFSTPGDYKILRNDWPYAVTPDITHLVVWVKNRIRTDRETGDLTPESRLAVDNFVQTTFVDRIGASNASDYVLWFKNWSGLQSVPGIDHVHVLVRNVPDSVLTDWTG